jgi:integrase
VLRSAPDTFERERDADQYLAEVETDLRRGAWFDPLAGRIPLSKYAAVWIDERDLSARAAELYRGLLRNHIEPSLGAVDVAELTPPAVRRWRKQLRDKGTSVGVMAKSYGLLHAVMETAVVDGSAKTNPCNIKGAGTYEPDERPTATLAQVFELADAIQPRYRLVVLLATFTSLRYGEIMGLRRRHLMLANGKVTIAKAAIQTDDGRTFDGDPKARSGWTLSLPAFLIPEIEAHLDEFVGESPNAVVFLSPKKARPTRANFHRVWNKARTKVGLPELHLHDLRHTGNTYAAETGATPRGGGKGLEVGLLYQVLGVRRVAGHPEGGAVELVHQRHRLVLEAGLPHVALRALAASPAAESRRRSGESLSIGMGVVLAISTQRPRPAGRNPRWRPPGPTLPS